MSAQDLELREAARSWAIRVQETAFDDWDGFTSWLERDPSHLPAYEAALADEAWAIDLLSSAPAVPSPETSRGGAGGLPAVRRPRRLLR